jgi:hypothetical protein
MTTTTRTFWMRARSSGPDVAIFAVVALMLVAGVAVFVFGP